VADEGKLTSLIVESATSSPDAGRVTQALVEASAESVDSALLTSVIAEALAESDLVQARVTSVLVEFFTSLPDIATSSYGHWPQESLANLGVQGRHLVLRRGQM